MKILVTGCAGFIGSHLCVELLKNNYIVYGIDILNDYYDINQKKENLNILNAYNNFTFEKENIIDTKIISKIKPDIVINIAAMAGVRYSLENPSIYMKTNIEGQVNLLKESVDNNVKLFIYASSSSVYGTNTKIPFCETDKITNPNSPYAASKKSGEIMAKLYNKLYNLPVIGLRFFTVYGPRGRPDMAPYKFLTKIMNGEKFDKYGEGNTYRDYTYIDDIISGIMGAVRNKNNKTCEVYNLGNSNTVTLNEFIETCEKVTNKKAIFNQLPEQKGDVPKTYADITKAQNDLDYNPKTLLFDGLTKMYIWLNKNMKVTRGPFRIVRIKDKIIITNYKCMYSSLNLLNICEFNPKDSSKYEKIMLYRDPYIRTISCFLNWMIYVPIKEGVLELVQEKVKSIEEEKGKVDTGKDKKYVGWLISILCKEKEFDFINYKSLLKENNIIELFKIYIQFLPKIKNDNHHMYSQKTIVTNYKFNIDTYINIDIDEDIMILKNKIKQNIPITNKSSNEDKTSLVNFLNKDTYYKDIIYKIYIDDFLYLPKID